MMLVFLIVTVEPRLGHLDIPVTVLAPYEVVDLLCGKTELEAVHAVCDLSYDVVQP